MTETLLTRLHITPLTPDLFPIALGLKLSSVAENVSYQKIPTFPEKTYAFLDLPSSDAKRLISKLNGAILKGRKMKVEEARPRKRLRGDTIDDASKEDKAQTNSRKAEKDTEPMEGYELPNERKVKRGWTEPKSERSRRKKTDVKRATKSQAPSKYTDKEELLFHTSLPPNKGDLGDSKKRKSTKKQHSDHTVHEFEKTVTQPSFLRNPISSSKSETHFVDGKGWVNEQGEVMEDEPPNVKRRRVRKAQSLKIDVAKAQQPRQSTKKLELEPISNSVTVEDQRDESPLSSDEETSSSGSSTDEESQLESTEHNTEPAGLGISKEDDVHNLPNIETQLAPETPTKVHPLETLFKKPKRPEGQASAKPSLEVETAFAFFGPDTHEEAADDDELPPMPVTPFTSYDLNSRGIRSAAPTPDTAHPSRFAGYAAAFESKLGKTSKEKDNTNGSELYTSRASETSVEPADDTEFGKRFWAERAQNNRAWKSRRRTAVKEERQRENRSRKAKTR